MRTLFLALLVITASAGSAAAECSDAVDGYNSAVSEVEYQLDRYTGCLSNSGGEDDCGTEFRRLRSAQGDYESAVDTYRNECDQ